MNKGHNNNNIVIVVVIMTISAPDAYLRYAPNSRRLLGVKIS